MILPQTNTYVKRLDDEIKWMNFLIKDDNLLKKYNDIWNRASNSIEKELDSQPIYIHFYENQNKEECKYNEKQKK